MAHQKRQPLRYSREGFFRLPQTNFPPFPCGDDGRRVFSLGRAGCPCRGRGLPDSDRRWLPPLWRRNSREAPHRDPDDVPRTRSICRGGGMGRYRGRDGYCRSSWATSGQKGIAIASEPTLSGGRIQVAPQPPEKADDMRRRTTGVGPSSPCRRIRASAPFPGGNRSSAGQAA